MRAKLLFLLLVALTGACVAKEARYSRAGTSQDEYIADRYECIAEAEQTVSNPFLAITGHATQTREMPNCAKWVSCMKARGYSLDPNGNLGVLPRMAIQCTE
jgi:hypothetical protein